MGVCTLNCMLEVNKPLDAVLTREDRNAIRQENNEVDASYKSLMNEMLYYQHMTLRQLISGWGGIRVFQMIEG